MDDSEWNAHTDPMLHGTDFFSPIDLDVAIDRLIPGTGFDSVHSSHIKDSKRCYRDLLCKLYIKLISHTYFPHSMFKGKMHQTVKNSSGNKSDWINCRLIMNSSKFLKILEYPLLSHLKKHLPVHENQFSYQPATSCVDTTNIL